MVLEIGLQLLNNSVTDSQEKSMLSRWRGEYEAYQKRKMRRASILEAIKEGYDTAAEISAHTGISDASVRRILIQLISQNKVKSAKTKNLNNRIELRFELASVLN